MKRILLTVALCVAATSVFAQKKAVSKAQSLAKVGTEFTEARKLIKEALENPETKDQAKTWFVAGFVEDKQFTAEKSKLIMGQKPNEPVMYEALGNILPYFQKAYELDQLPNEKGKVKPKHTKNIISILTADHIDYFNGGAYYFDQKDYKKAYQYFNDYIVVSNLPFMAESKAAQKDSTYMTVQFYAAVAATQIGDSKVAIEALERAKDTDYRRNDVYQYLCYEYEQAKDTVGLEKTLKEGREIFPDEEYYLSSLINIYIYTNQNEKAIELLNTAIAKKPNDATLYNVMGRVYETGLKDIAKAEECFKKALELKPDMTEAFSNMGRIYYNQGVSKLGEANMINDTQKYQAEVAVAKEFFKKALPYFKKAHEAEPDTMEYMIALRGIYYNLDMGPELEAIEKKMNQ